MTPFDINQWIVVLLVFLLGLFIGGYIFGSGTWKRRYREEVARREALEAEHKHAEAIHIAKRAREDQAAERLREERIAADRAHASGTVAPPPPRRDPPV